MKIIFFGSDDFAVTNLEKLIQAKYKVVACVTRPDKPQGRGLKVLPQIVKQCAEKHGVPVLQPDHMEDVIFISKLKKLKSDLFVVIAFGRILPEEILRIPKIFCINVHASLLPKYRGAAPINWAIINGEEKTGISIIKLNNVMDAGDIISVKRILIGSADTAVTFRTKMAEHSADLLVQTLPLIRNNAITLERQDIMEVTYAPKLTKELGIIKWDDPAEHIYNLARGLLPWPSAFTYINGKMLKILDSEFFNDDLGPMQVGMVMDVSKEGITVATGKGNLLIKKVHLESSKPMSARSFASGHKVKAGFRFR